MDALEFLKRSAVLLVAAVSMFLSCADAAVSPEELASTIRWFDGLQWPDLRDKPYVEVTFGKGYVDGKQVDGPQLRGFLLVEDDTGFTVFCDGTRALRISLDGRGWPCIPERFKKSAPDAPEDSKIVIRRLELADAVREVLGEVRRRNSEDEFTRPSGMDRRISDRTALFVLARCCARQGRSDLADRLDSTLMDLTPVFPSRRSGLNALLFPAVVENEIGHVQMWKAVVDFGNPEITRPELLNGFERLIRDFPFSEHSERARAFAESLRRMIAEDESHTADNRPLEELPVEEKVRELIFQLRDQNGRQFDQPGSCDIFRFGARNGDTPAHKLVALGYTAVPALIEALEDTRPTRSVGFHRDFYFSHYVLSVGDCAKQILSRIARRSFPTPATADAAMQRDRETKKTRAAVEAWWHDLQSGGEKSVLIDGVRAGNDDSSMQAEQLIALDPAAALEAIKAGIRNAQSHWTRSMLVGSLALIKSEDAGEALRQEMKACESLEARLAAARALFRRGDRDAIPAMIEEWRKWTPPSGKDASKNPERIDQLIEFLGTCNEPPAIRALADRFPDVPIDVRFKIIEAVTGRSLSSDRLVKPGQVRPPEVERVAEELVVCALDDRSTRFGISGSAGGVTFRDPRVCDVAAVVLAGRWPKKYQFKWATTRLERDPQIAEARNVWRASQGLTPSALPEHPALNAAVHDPNVVAAIRWIGGEELRDLKIVVGEPMSPESVIDTVTRLHQTLAKGYTGFTLFAERAGDRQGFVVEIEWQRSAKPARPGGWAFNTNITMGQKIRLSNGGGGGASSDYQMVGSRYENQRRSLEKALAADPAESVSISFQTMLNGQ